MKADSIPNHIQIWCSTRQS